MITYPHWLIFMIKTCVFAYALIGLVFAILMTWVLLLALKENWKQKREFKQYEASLFEGGKIQEMRNDFV